jgi:hypothetical protein
MLAGCGYSGSHASQVHQWVQQNSYWANESQVVADAHSVEAAIARGTALQVRTACGGLGADAGSLYSTLPTPDHPLTDDLNRAMQAFFAAGQGCAATPSTRSAAARSSLGQIQRALGALEVANRRLAGIGR